MRSSWKQACAVSYLAPISACGEAAAMGPKSAMEPVVRLACSDDNAPRRPTAVEGPCVLASGYLLSASDFPVQPDVSLDGGIELWASYKGWNLRFRDARAVEDLPPGSSCASL
ncbi:hypothetical protein M441DRAFT_70609 [Trichoderma asperellum CBS 433.97]|uniref:Uncharacterized protein n=1 Tax=Trichoderma asperellum (strain ATCC 204424 / CBS 433.97 / NBRC 101777) TaxID=1042311 RepID=A0A2T3Z3W3_TRIA4|nr:hypothetical protein M441DRAFT_70609 [Trichoderma asperellum CBS 433.97]PTB39489.1 hypothetical protein M441DRAFT_70609 [Trichoderma asperellum CBS 433.97]